MTSTASLLLALAFLFARSYGQTAQQPLSQQLVLQGMEVQLNCTYSSALYLYWYVQYPNKPLELLVSNYGDKFKNAFTSKEDKADSTYNLHKEAAELSDSGMYFCAVSDTVTQTELIPAT
ncbi:hypothetical protein XELAEV_18000288mg [Xenopus laevis]|uniref:Ig-like domain-containing protein n=1 Tax=Xenopus laevis TaxID=8355 RepID=A0A974BQK0_XENLA|nr:hypothetical protein XELAEV_18000288mg [Xenopus laevis]